ncbi:hypothetical protein [Actinocorallia longicatena]|uniref:XRE family transcriptional regulator n=1 Tax=Actinocorallia longicatena TaxID=111803 RepID=A0ABP6Q9D2_9ACTN
MHQIHGPGATLDDVLRTGPFHRALHLAIQARGLTLERLHARLRGQGLQVSVSSLSYWQRGRCRPERATSLRAVRALEDILELPSGSLIALLGAGADRIPGSLSYSDVCPVHAELDDLLNEIQNPVDGRLETLCHHESVTIGADRGERSAHSRVVFRARADHVDRYVAVHHCEDGPAFEGFEGRLCRQGRVRSLPAEGLTVVELVFDHPLAKGETYVLEYEFFHTADLPESTRYVRGFRFPAREYLLHIAFDTAAEPKRCYQTHQATLRSPSTDLRSLRLDNWNTVHQLSQDLTPGIHGIRWEWD